MVGLLDLEITEAEVSVTELSLYGRFKKTALVYKRMKFAGLFMVYTQHFCAKCGSNQIRRNGHSQGHAHYQCKACRHQARFEPAAVAKAVQYEQVDLLLGEHNSQRSIVRLTGVSRKTIASRIKKKQV